jgi:translocation and assembly module TamB
MTEVALGGTIRVRRADIRIPENLPSSVATIPVRIAGSPPPKPTTTRPAPAIAVALTLDAPDQIFVRGRGVDAELGGRIVFGGTLADLRPSGGLTLRRGTFSLIGQTLSLTEGRVDFTGAGIGDPTLRLVASSQRSGMTANAILSGRVRDPKITLTSVPELPQDEVLSQLLFNSSTAKLSPFQIAQVANALASLSGNPLLGDDPLNRMRQAVGLDRLTVGTDAAGRPVLEAGRYLADGVYIGTKQGASGGTQATIQVEIGKGVKLEATTGTGQSSATGAGDASNSTSVGITYQIEY